MIRLRWVWWTVTSWRRARRSTRDRDDRPGSDDQWATWPHPLQRFNDEDNQDSAERRWEP